MTREKLDHSLEKATNTSKSDHPSKAVETCNHWDKFGGCNINQTNKKNYMKGNE